MYYIVHYERILHVIINLSSKPRKVHVTGGFSFWPCLWAPPPPLIIIYFFSCGVNVARLGRVVINHRIIIIIGKAMSKPFDYSKWDNIELSDDEDDVHPNIDRESW